MGDLLNLEKLPPEARKKITPYAEEILELQGNNIISMNVYGSATGENYVPGVSDINLLFVCGRVNLPVLKSCLKVISKGISKKITAPLFLTEAHIRSSLDVFPMEFLDLKERHITIYGADILKELKIDTKHLRFVCEEQIKGKLIRIRQSYLEIGLKRKGIEALLKESLRSLMTVFKNLIAIKGSLPEKNNDALLVQLCREFGLDAGVFLPIYRDSSNDERIGSRDVEEFLEKYMDELQKLAGKVDAL